MNIQAIIPAKAESAFSFSNSLPITASFNAGTENQIAQGWQDETGDFHSLFSDDRIRNHSIVFDVSVLKDGIRNNAHALPTSILALDFDDPECDLEKVRAHFSDCAYVLYTTKSHQAQKGNEPPCDRFRIVLPLDRPLDPSGIAGVVSYFGARLHACQGSNSPSKSYRFGVADSLIFRHVHPLRLSADWLLSVSQGTASGASTVNRKGTVGTVAPKHVGSKAPHSKHVSFLRSAWVHCQTSTDTYANVFSLIQIWIQRFGFDLRALKSALPEVEDIADFYGRHPNQWQGIDATLSKAMAYVTNSERNTLKHRNRVTEIDLSRVAMTAGAEQASIQASKLTGEGGFGDTAKLIDHTFRNYRKAILDIQCGRGKSIVASAFVAASNDRWIFVKDTNAACRAQRELLLKYGVPAADTGVLSGWSKDMCAANLSASKNRKAFVSRVRALIPKGFSPFYSKKDSPCSSCWATCDFKNSRTHRKVMGVLAHRRVVVMTHSRFLELVHWGRTALEGFRIIADEEPAVFEGASFGSMELELLKRTFRHCLKGKVTGHLEGLLSSPEAGSVADPVSYDRKELKTLQGRCAALDPDDKETCYRYLHFMAYTAQRFAFVEPDLHGKRVSLIRNRLNFSLPNDMYVLSASACFSLAEWEGFTVVRSRVQASADGAALYAYECNSTKHRMDREALPFLRYALGRVKANGRKRVLLAMNKDGTQTKGIKTAVTWFKGECGQSGIEVTEGNRGTIIGRNDFRECDCVILAYGVFTSISNVCLKQSLVEGQEIDGSRVWEGKAVHGKRQPRIKKGMTDTGLRETDRRMYADEVYQVGLRGVARNWKGQGMDIITTCPAMDYLIPIAHVLPGCSITFGDHGLTDHTPEELEQNDKGLCGLFGMTDSDLNRVKARAVAAWLLSLKTAV